MQLAHVAPASAPTTAKLAAAKVVKEVAALREGAKALQTAVAGLVARKGTNPSKAAAALAGSVASLRKDVAKFKSATKTAPKQIGVTLDKLDAQLVTFAVALSAIPKDQPLSKGDANNATSASVRVMNDIDAVLGLLEPVVHR